MAMFEYTRLKEAISGWHRQLICRPCKATMHAWTMVTDAPVSLSRAVCASQDWKRSLTGW